MRDDKGRFIKEHEVPWTGKNNGNYKHGQINSPLYSMWASMKQRCYDKNSIGYQRYGGRGIKVCERWQEFKNFYADMSSSYRKGLTLDRVNNNGNYEPSNCRWATKKEQANNTRNVERAYKIEYKGIRDTIKNWANFFGIGRLTLYKRIISDWPIEKALLTRNGGGF